MEQYRHGHSRRIEDNPHDVSASIQAHPSDFDLNRISLGLQDLALIAISKRVNVNLLKPPGYFICVEDRLVLKQELVAVCREDRLVGQLFGALECLLLVD